LAFGLGEKGLDPLAARFLLHGFHGGPAVQGEDRLVDSILVVLRHHGLDSRSYRLRDIERLPCTLPALQPLQAIHVTAHWGAHMAADIARGSVRCFSFDIRLISWSLVYDAQLQSHGVC
jgi:hypothetical protein